jgi:nicotinate-nucleotide adenylyltransferase
MELGLDLVLIVPAGQPWMKSTKAITPAEHRLAMVRLAIQGKPHLVASAIELERGGLTYTVDTLVELRKQYGAGAAVYFIMGQDSLPDFVRWKDPQRILGLATLVVFARPGYPPPDIDNLQKHVPGLGKRVIFLHGLPGDISATDIRARLAGGKSLRGLVPEPVAAYIRQNGLYRG